MTVNTGSWLRRNVGDSSRISSCIVTGLPPRSSWRVHTVSIVPTQLHTRTGRRMNPHRKRKRTCKRGQDSPTAAFLTPRMHDHCRKRALTHDDEPATANARVCVLFYWIAGRMVWVSGWGKRGRWTTHLAIEEVTPSWPDVRTRGQPATAVSRRPFQVSRSRLRRTIKDVRSQILGDMKPGYER